MTAQHITPSELPEGRICKSINVPNSREWLGIFDKILLSATEEWNWQQLPDGAVTVEEAIAFWQGVLADYWDEAACATGGDVPAPFWDDPDGDDAGDEAPPGEQTWYEELSHWIVAGFLAYTFTPAAAIFYITTIRPARIAFQGRRYGAVVEILLDGILHDTVDTYSEDDIVINYDLNIPVPEGLTALAFDPVEVQIRHSGDHNPDATPTDDGYAISIIRDYFGRDDGSAPVSRINPDTGDFETTPDGGETWVENPNADPREQILFPALTGSDVICRSANSIVAAIESTFDQLLTGMANGGSAFSGAWLLVSLLAGKLGGTIGAVFFGAPVVAIAVFLISFIIDSTIAAVSSALTSDVYDKLRCILIILLDDEGRMPEENMPRLYSALYDEIGGIAAQTLDLFFDFTGHGGLSNFAAQDLDPLAGCACCPSGLYNYVEPFTGGLRWRTELGLLPQFGVSLPRGVWNGAIGRTALGCVQGTTPIGTTGSLWAYVTVDFGAECRFRGGAFWFRSASAVGGTPANKFFIWYDENGVELGRRGGVTGISTTWQTWSSPDDVVGVRYVTLGVSINGTSNAIYIDDVNVQWQP